MMGINLIHVSNKGPSNVVRSSRQVENTNIIIYYDVHLATATDQTWNRRRYTQRSPSCYRIIISHILPWQTWQMRLRYHLLSYYCFYVSQKNGIYLHIIIIIIIIIIVIVIVIVIVIIAIVIIIVIIMLSLSLLLLSVTIPMNIIFIIITIMINET